VTILFAVVFHCIRIAFLASVRSIGTGDLSLMPNEALINHVRTNILLQFFQNGTASLCANAFMTTFLAAGTGAQLLQVVKIRGIDINTQKILSMVRVILFIYTLTITLLWSISGLNENQESYYQYKRKTYLPFGFVVLLITGPALLFNGQKIIVVFEKKVSSEKNTAGTTGTTSLIKEKAHATSTRGGTPSLYLSAQESLELQKDRAKRRAVFGLKTMLYSTVFLLNFCTGLLFITNVFLLESFQQNQLAFVAAKVLFDVVFYFSSTIFAFYMIWK
jgi:hypothetical protein